MNHLIHPTWNEVKTCFLLFLWTSSYWDESAGSAGRCIFTTNTYIHTFLHCAHGTEPVFTATSSILPWLLCTSGSPHGAWWLVRWCSGAQTDCPTCWKVTKRFDLCINNSSLLRSFSTRRWTPSHFTTAAQRMRTRWPFWQKKGKDITERQANKTLCVQRKTLLLQCPP